MLTTFSCPKYVCGHPAGKASSTPQTFSLVEWGLAFPSPKTLCPLSAFGLDFQLFGI